MPLEAGDVVLVDLAGAIETKRRPAVVLSSDTYHRQRPDVMLGVLTTNIAAATTSSDHRLQDWSQAGLRRPSAFRTYFGMALATNVRRVGRLSARDWEAVRACVRSALG